MYMEAFMEVLVEELSTLLLFIRSLLSPYIRFSDLGPIVLGLNFCQFVSMSVYKL